MIPGVGKWARQSAQEYVACSPSREKACEKTPAFLQSPAKGVQEE